MTENFHEDVPQHPPALRRPRDRWVWVALFLLAAFLACFVVPHFRPGLWGMVLWSIGLEAFLWWFLAGILFLWAVMRSLWRRPFWSWWRTLGLVTLVPLVVVPLYITAFPIFFLPYPTSYRERPSELRFRVPMDGPIFVFWGGERPIHNYHAPYPDQCGAYDLVVHENGKSYRTDGRTVEDYYCYNMPVVAPVPGIVRFVRDGEPDAVPGVMGAEHAGGNEVVLEVAPNQFLFLCHLRAGSIPVKVGDRVETGQIIGRVGNSGNTSEPHLHIHLQDSAEDHFGEGIPMYFHHYRRGARIIERGIPTGGLAPQVIEHAPANE